MKYCKVLFVLVVLSSLIVSCKPASKDLTPEVFLQIENEILGTDLTPEAKETVVKKYNFTLPEFEAYSQKVESDPVLKAKVGEVRLRKMQGEQK
jgi:hypothetical protein